MIFRYLWTVMLFFCVIFAYSTPYAETLNQDVAQGESQETIDIRYGAYYTVRKGDTLWELSHRFFSSPWVWPSLWEKNKSILNPHWIYPGQQIYIYLDKDKLEQYIPEEPIPDHNGQSVISMIKPSDNPYYYYPAIQQIGFIRKEDVNPIGKIHKSEESQVLIAWDQNFFISPIKNHTFHLGEQYSVLRPEREVLFHRRFMGDHYLILGSIEITGLRPRFVKGKVVESYKSIRTNDLLVPYIKRDPNIRIIEDVPYIHSDIIASEDDKSLIGGGDVVHINKGESHGVLSGHLFSIFVKNQKELTLSRRAVHEDPASDYAIGSLLILFTERNTSAALITTSTKEMVLSSELKVY